jgi:hypothetical protein
LVKAALLKPPAPPKPPPPKPPPPKLGRSLAHEVYAAWYCAGIVGRVKLVPDGAEPLGVEVGEPAPGRRPPKRAVASLAGTPWLSRHWVYLAKAAVKEAEPRATVVGVGVVVADDVDGLELPPHAPSRSETARTGSTTIAARMVARRMEWVEGVTGSVNLAEMKSFSESDKSSIRTERSCAAKAALLS